MNGEGYCDAHCHWHDSRLQVHASRIQSTLESIPLQYAVVNGTSPEDWPMVAQLARRDHRAIPAFGLHPWQVKDAPEDWLPQLRTFLQEFPRAVMGEIGLDRWIEGHDLERQREVFIQQLNLAAGANRPVSIHCLQAWGPLLDCLRSTALPQRGFHLHGYGGSPELVAELVPLGGYFSYSAYVMHTRKERHRTAMRAVPEDRLLIETDAPDMLPPAAWQDFTLPGKVEFQHAPEGELLHHPANITASYRAAAEVRGVDEMALRRKVNGNFERYFLS